MNNPTYKRTKEQCVDDIESLSLISEQEIKTDWTQLKLVEMLTGHKPYTLTRQQIAKDLKAASKVRAERKKVRDDARGEALKKWRESRKQGAKVA